MSIFGRIFGGTSAEEERTSADRAFDAQNYYEARLGYEKALEKAKEADSALETHCRARIVACYDALAVQRIEEAERFRRDGELDLARTELNSALELAHGTEIKDRALRALELLEGRDAVRSARDEGELSDDERWTIIASNWDEAQLEEYDAYGEDLRVALLAVHDDKPDLALSILERLAESHPDAVYLWAELGTARLLARNEERAIEAFRSFLDRVDPEDRSNTRLAAYFQLASVHDRRQDEENALEWLQAAMTSMPDDPRPYLELGVYLRRRGYPEEAIEVLETAIELMDEDQPAWSIQQELGLAHRDAGQDDQAIQRLERVIAFFVSKAQVNFPPPTAEALAALHEKQGRLERAADLYRGLSKGSDREHHLRYHREAARVLIRLELWDEARRMLTRASALAEEDEETRRVIEADLATVNAKLD